jgi:hypothetical protein
MVLVPELRVAEASEGPQVEESAARQRGHVARLLDREHPGG